MATAQVETYTQQAKLLIRKLNTQNVELAAPELFRYELVAVTRKWVFQGRITAQEGDNILNKLLSHPVTLYFDNALLRRGYELAAQYNRPTAYDSQYLATAERLGCEFWTVDERLFNAIKDRFSSIRWIGNLTI